MLVVLLSAVSAIFLPICHAVDKINDDDDAVMKSSPGVLKVHEVHMVQQMFSITVYRVVFVLT